MSEISSHAIFVFVLCNDISVSIPFLFYFLFHINDVYCRHGRIQKNHFVLITRCENGTQVMGNQERPT